MFQGNANTYMVELRDVVPPIIGRRLRILPYSTHPKNVCLRVELYGCLWTGRISQSTAVLDTIVKPACGGCAAGRVSDLQSGGSGSDSWLVRGGVTSCKHPWHQAV